jgi:hypothetical protein
MAAGRGIGLIAIALLIGIILYNSADTSPATPAASSGKKPTATTTPDRTTIPPTTLPPLRAPADVRVVVVNGTSTKGAAAKVSDPLNKTAGYNTLKPADATAAVKQAPPKTTLVYFTAGFEREARAIATFLGLGAKAVAALPTPPPAAPADLNNANVVVLVGADLAAKPPASAGPTSSTTSTTAKP